MDAVLHDPLAGDRWGAGVPALRMLDLLEVPAAQRSAAVPLLGLPARLQPALPIRGFPVTAGDRVPRKVWELDVKLPICSSVSYSYAQFLS